MLKGIEANILTDGGVDMKATELSQLDVAVASPYSVLRSPADQTARMVAAVSTPGVHILGHPRGRMFGSRAGIAADWDEVFGAAAATGVPRDRVIGCWPLDRLLDWAAERRILHS